MRIPPSLVAVAVFGMAAFGAAQAPPGPWVVGGPEIQVNTTTTAYQEAPSVALGANHGFIVAWASDGQDGDGKGIYARRFDAAGLPVAGEFQINTTTAGDQYEPAIASDAAGNFVVVWTSEFAGVPSLATEVKGRLFDASGSPLTGEFYVNHYTNGYQLTPDVAMNASGFVVTWQSLPVPPQEPQDGDDGGIYARRFDAAGSPLDSQFLVNTQTTENQALPAISMNASGKFVIAYLSITPGGGNSEILAQVFDGSGPIGSEFQANAATTGLQNVPAVALGSLGDFVVAWQSQDGSGDGIFARAFDLQGTPLGGDFQIHTYTTNGQTRAQVAKTGSILPGGFIAVWDSFGPDGSPGNTGVSAQRYSNAPFPTAAFYLTQPTRVGTEHPINTHTTNAQFRPDVAMNDVDGRFVIVWESFDQVAGDSESDIFARQFGFPAAGDLAVDERASGGASNVNGILESGERVTVDPSWINADVGVSLPLTGTAGDLTGPPGPAYATDDATADYGTIPEISGADCFTATANCYEVSVSGARPATHWDATLDEILSASAIFQGIQAPRKTWALHVGGSFPDVPTDIFYPFIENLLHNRVTAGGGCGAALYCGEESVLRQQMAVFLLKAQYGADFAPPPATGAVFDDVPVSNPFAPWIEELARLEVTGGCAAPPPPALPSFCPASPVNRQQMAVFLYKTVWGTTSAPTDCAAIFDDVPCSNPFAPWVEYLVAAGTAAGCQASPPLYCPLDATKRKQMAAFLVKTFGLELYGPD